MNGFRVAVVGSLLAVLAGCNSGRGGGASANPPPPPPAAPSGLSYPAAPALTRGTAMASLTPTVTGTVASYTVTPALPAGLSINATSGVIGGTPTALAAAGSYQVTASNAGGSTSANVSLTVNDTPPSVDYPNATYSLSSGASTSITPTSTGGAVVTWTVNPALPAGLAINAATGVISGTPTTASATATYVVTATNSGGIDTFNLSLSVQNAVLFDAGHSSTIVAIYHDGQHILSLDSSFHAVIWNAQTAAIVGSRDNVRDVAVSNWPCKIVGCRDVIALHGNTAAVQSGDTLYLHDATNGATLATVTVANGPLRWWRLADDGSYVAAATDTELKAWTRSGTALFTKSANYASAKAFAAAAELRIGAGPAGANVIERLSIPAGASTTSASHQGSFHSWFDDGEKFLANVGTTVWVYSRNAVQLDLASVDTLEELHGQGNWFWTHQFAPKFVKFYAVGSSSTPAATYNFTNNTELISGTNVVAAVEPDENRHVNIIDLTGATPVKTVFLAPEHNLMSFGGASPTDWAFGATMGVMMGELSDPSPQLYSYGKIQSIAANADTIAVATAAGRVLQFDAATRGLTRQISLAANKIQLSSDGTQIIGGGLSHWPRQVEIFAPSVDLRSFSSATGSQVQQWPGANYDFDVARSTGVVSLAKDGGDLVDLPRTVTTLANAPLWSSTIAGGRTIFQSPDGTVTAINGIAAPTPPGVNLYTNGTISGAVAGYMGGWFDNSRLVINQYVPATNPMFFNFDHVEVVSTTGVVQSTLAIPEVASILPVTANSFYAPNLNKIFDATTGAVLFSSSAPVEGVGALSGTDVVFASGSTVRIEPR